MCNSLATCGDLFLNLLHHRTIGAILALAALLVLLAIPTIFVLAKIDAAWRPRHVIEGAVIAKRLVPQHTLFFAPPIPSPSFPIRVAVRAQYFLTIDIGGRWRRMVEVSADAYAATREGSTISVHCVRGRFTGYRHLRGVIV